MTAAGDAQTPDHWDAAVEQVRRIAAEHAGSQHLDQAGREAAGRILADIGASPGLLALAYAEALDVYTQTRDPADRAACVLLCHAHLDSLAAEAAAASELLGSTAHWIEVVPTRVQRPSLTLSAMQARCHCGWRSSVYPVGTLTPGPQGLRLSAREAAEHEGIAHVQAIAAGP